MHFLIAILGAVATIVFLVYRLRNAASQGKEIHDDVKGAIRRGRWNKQVQGRLIERIEDPREAAAILMVQIAAYDGEVTAGQKQQIENLMVINFDCDAEEAQGFYSFGRMAIGQINDAANSLAKLMRPMKESLTLSEMKGFVRMLETVAELEGTPTDRQRHLIAVVRRALSLDTAA